MPAAESRRVHVPASIADGEPVAAVAAGDLDDFGSSRRAVATYFTSRPAAASPDGRPTARRCSPRSSRRLTRRVAGRARTRRATAAMTATAPSRASLGPGPAARARASAVDSRPARKSGCATMRCSAGIVVRTPTTVYSASAREHAVDGRRPVGAPHDQLGQQRVVAARHRVALVDAGVLAHPGPGGRRAAR